MSACVCDCVHTHTSVCVKRLIFPPACISSHEVCDSVRGRERERVRGLSSKSPEERCGFVWRPQKPSIPPRERVLWGSAKAAGPGKGPGLWLFWSVAPDLQLGWVQSGGDGGRKGATVTVASSCPLSPCHCSQYSYYSLCRLSLALFPVQLL